MALSIVIRLAIAAVLVATVPNVADAKAKKTKKAQISRSIGKPKRKTPPVAMQAPRRQEATATVEVTSAVPLPPAACRALRRRYWVENEGWVVRRITPCS